MTLCLGTYGDPRGMGVSYERGTPVGGSLALAGDARVRSLDYRGTSCTGPYA